MRCQMSRRTSPTCTTWSPLSASDRSSLPVLPASQTPAWASHWRVARATQLTLGVSAQAVRHAWQNRLTRQRADELFQRWAQRLLMLVNTKYQMFHSTQIELEPNRPYMLMSNHRSFYDIPLLVAAFPYSLRMIAKKELFRVPIWGAGMNAAEFVSMDRTNREKAQRSLEKARRLMQDGVMLWIAPEGTRSRNGQLQPFKKGGFLLALQTGATIIPVGLRGTEQIMQPDSYRLTLGCSTEVHVGTPVDASQYSVSQRAKLMREVEIQIRALAGES